MATRTRTWLVAAGHLDALAGHAARWASVDAAVSVAQAAAVA